MDAEGGDGVNTNEAVRGLRKHLGESLQAFELSETGKAFVLEPERIAANRESSDNPTLTDLCKMIWAAQDRLSVDMLQVCLYGDGSGCVTAPARDWGEGGQRTDIECQEDVFQFMSLKEILVWLREGKLPEQIEAEKAAEAQV